MATDELLELDGGVHDQHRDQSYGHDAARYRRDGRASPYVKGRYA